METPGTAATLQVIDGEGNKRAAKGRINPDKQEAIITLAPVKERIEELERLYQRKEDLAVAFNDGVKACAQKAGLNASVLKKFVIARLNDQLPEMHCEQDQLALLLFDVGA